MEKLTDSEKMELGYIKFQAILEVVGKPKEHVAETLDAHLKKLEEEKDFEVIEKHIEEPVEQEEEKGVYTSFAEIMVWTKKISNAIGFCFDYMPSSIEILEPESLIFNTNDLTDILNDLQAKLHQVEMVAKTLGQENQRFNKSLNQVIKNVIMATLINNKVGIKTLCQITGVKENSMKPFLDKLIEEEKIEEKEGVYFLKEDGRTQEQN